MHLEAQQEGGRHRMEEAVVRRRTKFDQHIGAAGNDVGQRVAAADTRQFRVGAGSAVVHGNVVLHGVALFPCSAPPVQTHTHTQTIFCR